MSSRLILATLVFSITCVGVASVAQANAVPLPVISALSIPVNSMDATCYPRNEGRWSVAGDPIYLQHGIGRLVDPTVYGGYVLHDHQYATPHVPNPNRAVVTYEFSGSVIVQSLNIVQHGNGITQVEGFVGDSLGSLVSIGAIFGERGDITGSSVFSEFENNLFTFDPGNLTAGKYFRLVVTKTSISNGWASYRIYPNYIIPEPATLALVGLATLLARRRRV